MGFAQFFRNLKIDLDVEVTAGPFRPVGQTTVLEAESGVGLGPGRDFDIKRFAAQGSDVNDAAQGCRGEGNLPVNDQIVTISTECCVGKDLDQQVKVAGWTAGW